MTDNVELNPALSTVTSEVKTDPDAKGSEYRTLHQHELNDLLKEQRERGYRKAQQEFQQTQPQSSNGGMPPGGNVGMGGMAASPQISQAEISKLVEQKLQEQAHLARGHQIVNQFMGKMMAGKDKYPDFENVVSRLGDLSKIPQIVELANGTDNTHDVMYDLGQNPHKVANLLSLAQFNPHLAMMETQKLANSIKANHEAAGAQVSSPPLSQINPSVSNDNASTRTSLNYFKGKYKA